MSPNLLLLAVLLSAVSAPAQIILAPPQNSQLAYVVFVTRHGIRSPTSKSSQYDQYSRAAWPTWKVPPGYLTPHGFQVIQSLGRYDRNLLDSEGLFSGSGCSAAEQTTLYADSDERTRETGKALAAGLFPGCSLEVQGLPERQGDPLFHTPATAISPVAAQLAAAAIAGRIGGDPSAVAEAYLPGLTAFDHILATCGTAQAADHRRTSLLDIPATLTPGSGDHAAEMRGPLNTASTLSENLLEYTEGMDLADVGWGCVDAAKLRSLIELHTAASDLAQRTRAVATVQGSNLLDTIRRSMLQAATAHPEPHIPGKPGDRALFLVGHDTNLSNLAGMLDLDWLADGRRDDTPPGSTLAFELWRSSSTGELSVRLFFIAQTLEQMRAASELTAKDPPQRVPVFIPGCSRPDLSCRWEDFAKTLLHAGSRDTLENR